MTREEAARYFEVRLWDSNDLIENPGTGLYDRLDDDLKPEIPLKRMWALATPGVVGEEK